MVRILLSPVEQAYVNGTRQYTKNQRRYIRYRLNKKLRRLGGEDFQVFGIPSSSRHAAAAKRDGQAALVAQPGRALSYHEIEKKKEALGGILGTFRCFRARDLYLTKVTLYQAELPRQLNEQSSQ